MTVTFVSALFLACFWGLAWAAILQFTSWGRWLALRRTWVSVVIGVGVDLLILGFVLSLADWLQLVAVIGLSSIGLVVRSLYNEHREEAS